MKTIEKKMKKSIFVFAILIFNFSNLLAQVGGLNFTLGFPSGEFKENVTRTGIGLSGHFLILKPTLVNPFSLGINVGYLNYGNESRNEPFSSTIPDVTVNVDRSNNIVNFHLLFQLILPSGIIRPYFEGLFGGAYIYTETTINSRGVDEVASSNNFDDFAWSYGPGGGFLIQISSSDNPDDNISDIFIDLKARYLFGSNAEYLKEGSVKINNGKISYDVSESKTDLITAQIGVVIYFNGFD